MKKTKLKFKSSALLIAIAMGIILSALLTGAVLMISQQTKQSGQDREGQMAYRAALSGIEDGLLRYKYARSQGKESLVFRTLPSQVIANKTVDSPKVSYDLSVKMEALSVGNNLEDGNFNNWQEAPKQAITQKALRLLCDDTLDIDLSYLINNFSTPLDNLTIYFSKPFYFTVTDGLYHKFFDSDVVFSAVNYQLVDLSKTGEEQLLDEKTNNIISSHAMTINGLDKCTALSECHLKIKPQAAQIISDAHTAAGRLSANGVSGISGDNPKYIFFKISAKHVTDIIPPTLDKPGTIIIESVGKAGEARRKLQAKIDASTGAYVGLADFGVFCGKNCQMPNINPTATP